MRISLIKIMISSVVLAVSAFINTASAGLIDVAKIEIRNAPGGQWLQVSEVFAWESLTGNDLALASAGATASATSYYIPGLTSCGDGTANCAIDSIGPASWSNLYHANNSFGDVLTVTLASPNELDSLAIAGRIDCCSTRDIFEVTLFDSQGAILYEDVIDARGSSHIASVLLPNTNVPEPATVFLFGLGLAGLGFARKNKA